MGMALPIVSFFVFDKYSQVMKNIDMEMLAKCEIQYSEIYWRCVVWG